MNKRVVGWCIKTTTAGELGLWNQFFDLHPSLDPIIADSVEALLTRPDVLFNLPCSSYRFWCLRSLQKDKQAAAVFKKLFTAISLEDLEYIFLLEP